MSAHGTPCKTLTEAFEHLMYAVTTMAAGEHLEQAMLGRWSQHVDARLRGKFYWYAVFSKSRAVGNHDIEVGRYAISSDTIEKAKREAIKVAMAAHDDAVKRVDDD